MSPTRPTAVSESAAAPAAPADAKRWVRILARYCDPDPALALGFGTLLWVQIPVTLLSGAIGVWLFYVQHQLEDAWWERDEEWSFHAGALLGSTHYELPGVLRWMTANIGVHHVHHLASRIPSYRLGEALADHPELRAVGRLGLRESLRCFRLALWDEDAKRLVAFRDLRALPAPLPA